MARRRVLVREVSDVLQVAQSGGPWETKTIAQAEHDFSRERGYWNSRGYETRVERGVVSEYLSTYVPFGASVVR